MSEIDRKTRVRGRNTLKPVNTLPQKKNDDLTQRMRKPSAGNWAHKVSMHVISNDDSVGWPSDNRNSGAYGRLPDKRDVKHQSRELIVAQYPSV